MNDIEKQIQDLLERRQYIQLYQEQPKVINMMLLVEDQAEFEDYLADMDDPIEERVFWQFYSVVNGKSIEIGGYEGDAEDKVCSYLRRYLPPELYEKTKGIMQNLYVDMDEDDQLEKRVCQCNQILEASGYRIQLEFDDTYYTGVYFLSVTEGE